MSINQPPTSCRALFDLSIDLPISLKDALYSVRFRNPFSRSVFNAVGTAAWDGSAETLVTAVDLRQPGARGIHPGSPPG